MQAVTWWGWLALLGVAAVTFVLYGMWRISGFNGGAMDEPPLVPVVLAVTAIAGGIMWYAGWLP